ncbi:hypothetical protein QUF64_03295 [Anaerolineales bacterium HSG6]|nr:hypothetical protein [Anaerolineales bacterium HSG6]MDM8531584.1 hypothetical protein [Anaerolineales bacterium HSG25]
MIITLQQPTPNYPDLTFQQQYIVIGIESDDLRVLNDHGQPYLYPHALFEIIDSTEPQDWVTEFGDDGERYAYPPALNTPGFFEDFFDANKQAVMTFWRVINQRLVAVMAQAA